jgi:hypothetical protein
MKYLTFFIFLLFAVSSCRRDSSQQLPPVNQSSPITENLELPDPDYPFRINSLTGYSVHFHRWQIELLNDGHFVFYAAIYSINDYYLPEATKLDSVDIARGFVLARALTGPALDAVGHCIIKYSIDSIYEYHNKFNARCFRIRIKGIESCAEGEPDTSYFQGYWVDISQGKNYQIIQIPNQLDFLDSKYITEASEMLANNIKVPPFQK